MPVISQNSATLWRYIRNNRFRAAALVVLGLLVGVGGHITITEWVESGRAPGSDIRSVKVVHQEDGGYQLVIDMLNAQTKCVRASEHVISPDFNSDAPILEPLASSIAGARFARPGNQTIILKVHPYMVSPDSTWYYRYRATYMCPVWPGFMSVTNYFSRPVAIHFDGYTKTEVK